jgi:hypothetical protein
MSTIADDLKPKPKPSVFAEVMDANGALASLRKLVDGSFCDPYQHEENDSDDVDATPSEAQPSKPRGLPTSNGETHSYGLNDHKSKESYEGAISEASSEASELSTGMSSNLDEKPKPWRSIFTTEPIKKAPTSEEVPGKTRELLVQPEEPTSPDSVKHLIPKQEDSIEESTTTITTAAIATTATTIQQLGCSSDTLAAPTEPKSLEESGETICCKDIPYSAAKARTAQWRIFKGFLLWTVSIVAVLFLQPDSGNNIGRHLLKTIQAQWTIQKEWATVKFIELKNTTPHAENQKCQEFFKGNNTNIMHAKCSLEDVNKKLRRQQERMGEKLNDIENHVKTEHQACKDYFAGKESTGCTLEDAHTQIVQQKEWMSQKLKEMEQRIKEEDHNCRKLLKGKKGTDCTLEDGHTQLAKQQKWVVKKFEAMEQNVREEHQSCKDLFAGHEGTGCTLEEAQNGMVEQKEWMSRKVKEMDTRIKAEHQNCKEYFDGMQNTSCSLEGLPKQLTEQKEWLNVKLQEIEGHLKVEDWMQYFEGNEETVAYFQNREPVVVDGGVAERETKDTSDDTQQGTSPHKLSEESTHEVDEDEAEEESVAAVQVAEQVEEAPSESNAESDAHDAQGGQIVDVPVATSLTEGHGPNEETKPMAEKKTEEIEETEVEEESEEEEVVVEPSAEVEAETEMENDDIREVVVGGTGEESPDVSDDTLAPREEAAVEENASVDETEDVVPVELIQIADGDASRINQDQAEKQEEVTGAKEATIEVTGAVEEDPANQADHQEEADIREKEAVPEVSKTAKEKRDEPEKRTEMEENNEMESPFEREPLQFTKVQYDESGRPYLVRVRQKLQSR